MPTLETFKCPSCGHVYFWNGKGERPGTCTQKRGWKRGRFTSCGQKLVRLEGFDDVKHSQRRVIV